MSQVGQRERATQSRVDYQYKTSLWTAIEIDHQTIILAIVWLLGLVKGPKVI
jgi:hypothetical protein